ncbi:unnamed protein product [Paramecium octaurelia]|uniref:Uncharacterized protein n=1 Tax=Paramecium octaurelia TaxID=43137 RepID=A0A8S1TWB1_PAROT|nr:unnamed protein product [Paramecium octaurelia]
MEKQLCLQHMQIIQSVCLERECYKQYYCCCECLLETHQNHQLMNANDFQDLEKSIKDSSQQLLQDIEFTQQIVFEQFNTYRTLVDNYISKQNQINKKEFAIIQQSISQRLLKIRHLILKKVINEFQIKLLWTEDEIQEISQYLQDFDNKDFIQKLADWQEKLREEHNSILSNIQIDIETEQCEITTLEQQDQSIYYGQNVNGTLHGRGIIIGQTFIQDGLFKNGQFVYGLWLVENQAREIISKEGVVDEQVQRQMKSIIVQTNYLKTIKDYDELKTSNIKRFQWDEQEQEKISQILQNVMNPKVVNQHRQLLLYFEIPEEYHYLQFIKYQETKQINKDQLYFGSLMEDKQTLHGRGILFEGNYCIKDGIWEEGEFIWGIWISMLNNQLFQYYGTITEEQIKQYEEFKLLQKEQEKQEQDEIQKLNHQKKLRFFKRIYQFMDTLISGYVHNVKLKEVYNKNKLDKEIDVNEKYLQFENEPDIIRNNRQLYIGFQNADGSPNSIGFYCDQNLIAGGYWENGILLWGTYHKYISETDQINVQQNIPKDIQEKIQIIK